MNAALGATGVLFTAAIAVVAIVVLAVGLLRGRPELVRMGPRFAWAMLATTVVSVIAMQRALITRDFSLEFVANHGSTRTPPMYNVATMWSALEGSILLWALVLVGYVVVVAVKFRKRAEDPLVGWALLTMFAVVLFFAALMLGPANPFRTVSPVPLDGPGPNPLLQNHWLVSLHPPMLYLGYVGFTVPFAFAIAALVTGRVGEGWLLETRRWTLFAWAFLTAGIVLGGWWSYDVLGWGGYWGWDPVENASLLPWLTGTAYLHSVMVQERRGMLRVWNLSLVCATFALTILGTFITRSGVAVSVHAFSEGNVGPVLLAFFAVIVAVTVGLVYWRGDRLRAPGRVDSPMSREGAFFANNLLFAAFAFVVLLGTVFPLIVEAANGDQISVGGPYFERMTRPIGLVLLFLMAVAPALPWRKTTTEVLAKRLEWPAWMGAAALVLAVAVGARGLWPLLGFGLGGFAAGAALRQLVLATRRQGWRGLVGRANGGMIVHLGVIIVAVAFTASQSFSSQAEFSMVPGDTVTLSGRDVTYLGIEEYERDHRIEDRAIVEVDGTVITPSVNRYLLSGMSIGTPDTNTSLVADVQVALLTLPETLDGAVVLRVTIQPLVSWLWLGGGVIFVGAFLAAFPGQRRRPTDPVSAPLPTRQEVSS